MTEPNDLGLKIEWDGEAKNWMASGIVADGPRRAAVVTSADTIPELLRKAADLAEAMLREPSEAEKIDARRAAMLLKLPPRTSWADLSKAIRASDEAAGYVLAPTSGVIFNAIADSVRRAIAELTGVEAKETAIRVGLRAALESLKGEGR